MEINQHIWQLEWDDSLSTGIPEIDRDHQNFLRLVNELNRAIADHLQPDEIRNMMKLLLDDAALHFVHEEVLFRQWHYPAAEEHAQKHASLIRRFHEIMDGLGPESPDYAWIEASLKIKFALTDHLLHEDMKYRDFYQSMPH